MSTPNTGIPYVPEGTLDPAAGLNIALNVIDALLQTAVISMTETAPPGTAADGDLYIVASPASGLWANEDNNLARYVEEGAFWQFFTAGVQVHFVLNKEDLGLYRFDSIDSPGSWALIAGLGDAPVDGDTYGRKDGAWEPVVGGGGSGALQYVGEAVVIGAAATNITLSGLDLAADECYEIDLIVDNATASISNVSLFYNGDTTATNYDRKLSQDGGTATHANDALALFMAASSTSFYHLTLRNDFDGRPRALVAGSTGNTTALSGQVGSQMWRTAANVTSITLSSAVASGFSIGSKVIVWKRTT